MTANAIHQLGGIFAGAGLAVGAAVLLGRPVVAWLERGSASLSQLERWLFALALGAAALGNIVFALCAIGAFYDASVLAVAALGALAAWRWGRWPVPPRNEPEPGPHSRLWYIVLIGIGAWFGYLYIPHAIAPEIRADGVGYHLGLIGRYYRDHGFPAIETNVYAYLSQGAEMLYLFAYAIGRHSAAKLVHFCLLVATVAALVLFARRLGSVRAGIVAAILFACSPAVAPDATSTYNDCALAFLELLTVYALLIWWENESPSWLLAAGALAGFCFAIKYTGYPAVLLVGGAVVCRTLQQRAGFAVAARRVAWAGLAASLFIVPWLAKNALLVGNPVAPLFNRVFPNPYVTAGWEDNYSKWLKHYGDPHPDGRIAEVAAAVPELLWGGVRYQGMLGPIFVLAPLGLFALRRWPGALLWIAAAVFAIPWFSNAGVRFLIPSLVFVALAMGLSLAQLPPRAGTALGLALVAVHAFTSWPPFFRYWHPQGVWALNDFPWAAALRIEPEDEYLSRFVPHYNVARYLHSAGGNNARVFTTEPLPEAYTRSDVITSYQGAINEEIAHVLIAAAEKDFWPRRKVRLRWSPQALTAFRIVQENSHEYSHWRMSEIRFVENDAALAAEPAWEITAFPCPTTARRAFDGDNNTSWNSWERLFPGMKIEVEFGQPRTWEGADLIYTWEQYFIKLTYWGRRPDGKWAQLEVRSEETEREVSPEELKAAAHRELKKHAIEYLVTNLEGGGHNFIAKFIDEGPSAWGLEEVFADGAVRVYRVR